MRPLSKASKRILDRLTTGLADPGASQSGSMRKLDNAPDTYMPLTVERIGPRTYSLAHYFKQNGDLVPDPDMVFYLAETGEWLPVSCKFATGYTSEALEVDAYLGTITGIRRKTYNDLRSFATTFLRNIKEQQL